MRARNIRMSLILMFSALCRPTQAHRPIFSEKSATDPNTAVLITQPDISQVIYREITQQAKQVWLALDANEGFELFVQIGVPVLDRLREFKPSVLIVGPGLPFEGKVPFELPEGLGARNFPTDSVEAPRFFHEHFTGTDSWILRSESIAIPKSGRYYVVAYVPTGQMGKLWLSVGRRESFGLAEWVEFGGWKRRIRSFHEVNEEGRKLRMPILREIGDFLGLGNARPDTEKSRSKDPPVEIREGVRIHEVETEYQNGKQEIRVLLPDHYRKDKQYFVLYVLPVEQGFDQSYGYGLGILKQMDAQNKHDIIIVQMGFEEEPWYGDHATDAKIRQASYLKEFVVPFIEKRYSTMGKPEGRLLFGFSKSGWGAFSLIFTYPEFFGYAASWDAPMCFDKFHYKMKQVYGTVDQLKTYRPDLLVSKHKEHFYGKTRLVLAGQRDWGMSIPTPTGGDHTVEMHRLLDKEGVRHIYYNSLKGPHRWDQQWMAPTLAALIELTRAKPISMQLWNKVDIASYKRSFVCVGDLTGDQQVDFLLYRQGPQTTPGFLAALDHAGQTVWELGDPSLEEHVADGTWNEPALRGTTFALVRWFPKIGDHETDN